MFAIVDIETTGGYSTKSRITEIGIICHDGKQKTDTYHTLINPQSKIPPFITSLTGITNEMVADAPVFEDVAKEVYSFLRDKSFIAHNVNFDYSFLKQELASCGLELKTKKLCTVRLGRKLIPGLRSYGLGNLCAHLSIPIFDRHRALGDASATTILFEKYLSLDCNDLIQTSLKKGSKEAMLPPNVSREDFDRLPETTGVYYFYNKAGKVLYVGKAINIKSRVTSHFSGKSETRLKPGLINDIHSIGFEQCGNELLALLLECHEIKKYWPPYNNSHKRNTTNTGIYLYEDIIGYKRLCISPVKKFEKPVFTFQSITEARNYLIEKCEEHNLCPRLCGLQKLCCENDCCKNGSSNVEETEEIERYNLRLMNSISTLDSEKSFVLAGKGISSAEKSFVMIENGRYQGFGYYPTDSTFYSPQELKSHLRPFPDNPDIQRIISSYVRNNSHDVEYFPFIED